MIATTTETVTARVRLCGWCKAPSVSPYSQHEMSCELRGALGQMIGTDMGRCIQEGKVVRPLAGPEVHDFEWRAGIRLPAGDLTVWRLGKSGELAYRLTLPDGARLSMLVHAWGRVLS